MHAWTWFFQRISAVIIIVVLGLHIGYLHFSNSGAPLEYSYIIHRLKTPVFIVLDLLLLVSGLYHALYGLYSVLLDFDSGKKERVIMFGILVVSGLAFAGFGIFGLLYAKHAL